VKNNSLIYGDCYKELPSLKCNLIVTDPPYEYHDKKLGSIKTKLQSTGKGDFYAQGNNRKRLEQVEESFGRSFNPTIFLEEAKNICTPFNAYIFTNKTLIYEYLSFAKRYSLLWDILIWHKPNAVPVCKGHYLMDKEYCIFIRESGAFFNSNLGYRNYFTLFSYPIYTSKKSEHPTEKPVSFIKKMIRISSKPNDIILDPFCGSGTTCVAAEELGRRWVGIEVKKKYYDMAAKRINVAKRNKGLGILV